MQKWLFLMALAFVASCGAAGAPVAPSPNAGVTMGGEVSVGVATDGG